MKATQIEFNAELKDCARLTTKMSKINAGFQTVEHGRIKLLVGTRAAEIIAICSVAEQFKGDKLALDGHWLKGSCK